METFERLAEIFKTFPGIGPRQAKRFVYHLIQKDASYIKELEGLIKNLKASFQFCLSCQRIFPRDKEKTICSICANLKRDRKTLMIVPKDADLEIIEKSGSFKGNYFVLGGTIPILDQDPEKRIRGKALRSAVEKRAKEGLSEIILAMNATPEGENTAHFLISFISPITNKFGVKISYLGRGLSTGSELEYSDAETLKNALKNRSSYS